MSRVLTGAFFFLFTVLSADVSAQQRIVVAPFSGPQGARVHAQVVENLLENGVQLIDWSEVEALTGRSSIAGTLFELLEEQDVFKPTKTYPPMTISEIGR